MVMLRLKTNFFIGWMIGFFLILSAPKTILLAQSLTRQEPQILPMRERARVIDRWLEYRLDVLIPELMKRENIDMWVLVAREYNEDPVLLTMLPATWQSSRRTTILVFSRNPVTEEVDRLAVARYNIGFFETQWDPQVQPDQWKRFAEIVQERNPSTIAVNTSDAFAQADGISYTDYSALKASLPAVYQERIVSGERLAIGWLETRTQEEMATYRQINRIAHQIIEEGFSEAAITPGVTTSEDLRWWFRQRILDRGLNAWFHPSIQIIRAANTPHSGDYSGDYGEMIIQPGDVIHVDFGVTYLRLNTDTQRNAYVLRPGETSPPQGLIEALATANRLQDILTNEFTTGRTGNEILASALNKAQSEGIKATIYTHPIGYYGHGAGTTIGLWDQQQGVPVNGDYPLYANTAHSIELNAEVFIPEWTQSIRVMLEEDAFFDGQKVEYIDGRAIEFYLIPRP